MVRVFSFIGSARNFAKAVNFVYEPSARVKYTVESI